MGETILIAAAVGGLVAAVAAIVRLAIAWLGLKPAERRVDELERQILESEFERDLLNSRNRSIREFDMMPTETGRAEGRDNAKL